MSVVSTDVCRVDKKGAIQRGVIAIPMTPDMLALKIAAGTLPRARETITTDEVTVEGNAARKRKANQMVSCFCSVTKGYVANTISGNNTNVLPCASR